MRVLFDQGTPVPLRHHLPQHSIRTAFELGWSALNNGELLAHAEAEGFDALVTTDRNLKYQQNLADRRIAVIVLSTTSWPRIQANVSLVLRAIDLAVPGRLAEVQIPQAVGFPRSFRALGHADATSITGPRRRQSEPRRRCHRP